MRFPNIKIRDYFVYLIFGVLLVYVLLAYFRGDVSVAPQKVSGKIKNEERKENEEIEKNLAIAKKKNETISRNVTILLWTAFFDDESFMFGVDENPFTGENRCAVDNCLVTNNRKLMNIEDFDAVVFHLWGNSILGGVMQPPKRNPDQFYVFASLANPEYNPTIDVPNGFFNWTLTYRADSDFQWPYFKIVDKNNPRIIVAPSETPQWIDFHNKPVDNKTLLPTLKTKHKKVAWFVSRCETKNSRERYTDELQKYTDIDIYGKCGPLNCEIDDLNDTCHKMLAEEYYFFLSFESADCPDYVSESVLHALQHDTVPIVYGGANYTRYLPPHSYINAKDYEPKELAELMDKIMKNHTEYAQYFWWKEHYILYNIGGMSKLKAEPYLHPFCEMCEALQNPNLQMQQYDNIEEWWTGPEDHSICFHS